MCDQETIYTHEQKTHANKTKKSRYADSSKN